MQIILCGVFIINVYPTLGEQRDILSLQPVISWLVLSALLSFICGGAGAQEDVNPQKYYLMIQTSYFISNAIIRSATSALL